MDGWEFIARNNFCVKKKQLSPRSRMLDPGDYEVQAEIDLSSFQHAVYYMYLYWKCVLMYFSSYT
jgi:hypothetical protein